MSGKKNRKIRGAAFVIALVMMLALFPTYVFAAGDDATAKTGSITLSYPCSGITFQLYQLADFDSSGELELKPEYQQITFDPKDQGSWEATAATADAYVASEKLDSNLQAVTTEDGKAIFAEVPLGVYLVRWESHVTDGVTYFPEPFLVTVPNVDEKTGAVLYDLTPQVKYKTETKSDHKVSYLVHKKWDDQDDVSGKRPTEITVTLLHGEEPYDVVKLNAENGWSHTWEDLEPGEWKVSEKDVPSGYTTLVSREGTSFLITNTLKTPPNQPPSQPPKTPGSPRLPQTGLLWWPVPLLTFVGLLLVAIGWVLMRRSEYERNADRF